MVPVRIPHPHLTARTRVKCVIVYVTQSSLVLLCSRTEEVEKNSQLRTRAMREAEKRPSKTYRFTLVRIRLPDGIILQGAYFEPTGFSVPLQVYSILLVLSSTGTFYSREKLQDVFEFVRQSLVSDWQPFLLFEAGRQLKDENATLVDLGLVSKKRHFQKVRFDYVYFLSSLLKLFLHGNPARSWRFEEGPFKRQERIKAEKGKRQT